MSGARLSDSDALRGVEALVTGSSRGLGFGIARTLAAEGARLWLVAELADELIEAADELKGAGARVETRVVDLSDDDARAGLTAELLHSAPNLRVLVNNAAVLDRRAVAEVDAEHWDRTMAVNLRAPVLLTRDLLPVLQREGGSIVNVSSRAGVLAFDHQAAYCASKFGLEAFTRCLAIELAGSHVSVNSVTPGLRIKPTSLTRADSVQESQQERAAWHDPVELGPAFVFLAGLRGEVSGYRFDARVLSQAVGREGVSEVLKRVDEFAEFNPAEIE